MSRLAKPCWLAFPRSLTRQETDAPRALAYRLLREHKERGRRSLLNRSWHFILHSRSYGMRDRQLLCEIYRVVIELAFWAHSHAAHEYALRELMIEQGSFPDSKLWVVGIRGLYGSFAPVLPGPYIPCTAKARLAE